MLEAHLFGPFRLSADGGHLSPFPTHASMLLFSYLVLHRSRKHSRDSLATLLAGDRGDRVARKKLRQELWRVRSVLAECEAKREVLEVGQRWIGIAADASLWVDAEQFELAIRSVDDLDDCDPSGVRQLERAYDLYSGPLLDGEYEAWCLVEQDRFRAIHHEVAERLVAYYARGGQWTRALRYAREILRYDSIVEHAHRQVMALHFMSGDRPSALRHFAECRRILARELDVEPMRATVELVEAIRAENHSYVASQFRLSPSQARPSSEHPRDSGSAGLDLLRRAADHMLEAQTQLMREMESLAVDHRIDRHGRDSSRMPSRVRPTRQGA